MANLSRCWTAPYDFEAVKQAASRTFDGFRITAGRAFKKLPSGSGTDPDGTIVGYL